MPPPRYRDFSHGSVLPATYTDALEDLLSGYEARTLNVSVATPTSLQVTAGGDTGSVAVSINGEWRHIEASQTRSHPGGAAGTYDVYVVGAANSFATGAPDVGEIDNTFYGFELRIVPSGDPAPTGTLTGGQTIAVTRRVRTLEWDGAAITRLDRLSPEMPAIHATSHEPGGSDPLPVDAAAGVGSLRTLGIAATQAAAGNDPRLGDSRPPTGPAGGDLSGVYPNPSIKADVALAGAPTAVTPAQDSGGTRLATAGYVLGQAASVAPAMDGVAAVGVSPRWTRGDHVHPTDTSRAPLASPAFTGIPTTAASPGVDDNTTKLATTGYVFGQLSSAADGVPAMDGVAARGTSTRLARANHVHPTDTSRAAVTSPAFNVSFSLGTILDINAVNASPPANVADVRFGDGTGWRLNFGPRSGVSSLQRYAWITDTGVISASALQLGGVPLAASHLSNGVTGTGAVVLTNAPTLSGYSLSDAAAALQVAGNFRATGYLEAIGDSWVHGHLRLAATGYTTLDLYNSQEHIRAGGSFVSDGYLQSGSHIYLHGTQLFFGAAEDTYLERQAANLIRTSGGFAVGGSAVPSAGTHIELTHNGSVGIIESYGRTSALHYPLNLYGSTITLTASPGGERLTVDSGGFAFMGREGAYGTGLVNYGVSTSGGGVTQLQGLPGGGTADPNNILEVMRSLLRTLHKKGIITITDFPP